MSAQALTSLGALARGAHPHQQLMGQETNPQPLGECPAGDMCPLLFNTTGILFVNSSDDLLQCALL